MGEGKKRRILSASNLEFGRSKRPGWLGKISTALIFLSIYVFELVRLKLLNITLKAAY